MLNRIWTKLSLAVIAIVLVIMTAVFYVFTVRQISQDRQELRVNMERIAMQIASIRLAETEGWYVYQDWIDSIIESDIGKDLVYIAIFDENHTIVAHALNPDWIELDNGTYLTRDEQFGIVKQLSEGRIAEDSWNDFDHVPVEIRWGRDSLGEVDVGFSLIEFNNRVRRQLWINFYLLLGFLIASTALSMYISFRITRPINKLSVALRNVSKGDLDQEIHSQSKDELGQVSRSFNYMTRRLREKADIEKFASDLGYSFEYSRLAQMITEQIVHSMHARQGVIFIIEKQDDKQIARTAWGYPTRIQQSIEIDMLQDCETRCVQDKHPIPVDQLVHDARVRDFISNAGTAVGMQDVRLLAPLITQNELVGFLLLSGKTDHLEYDEDEIAFLHTLTHQAALAVENSFLLKELTARERMKHELEIARQVQQRLLPAFSPYLSGLDITGTCIPATEVGGDYFDYFVLSDHKIGIAIADVSGKGTSAAFYMAELKGMMTSLAQIIESPRDLLTKVNALIGENMDKRVFATMIYGILDIHQKTFTFVRAGHNALVVKRANRSKELDVLVPQGIGMGLIRDETFKTNIVEQVVELEKDDVLILYTDGISEAMNEVREEFGEESLFKLLQENGVYNTSALQDSILDAVKQFVKGAPQHDDITMVLARLMI